MSKASASAITAAATVAAGGALTVWTGTSLGAQGAWSRTRIAAGELDFTMAALLLVGVALLITGVIIALATLAEFWFDAQDRYDAQVEARDRRLALKAAQTRPDGANRVAH